MRIGFILNEFPALSETFVLNQITDFINAGHEVEIYAERPRVENRIHSDIEKFNLLNQTKYENCSENYFSRGLSAPGLLAEFFPHHTKILFNSLDFLRYGLFALSLRTTFAARSLLSAEAFDVLLCHFYTNGQKAVRLRQIGAVKGKIITVIHSFDISQDKGKNKPNY